MDGKAAKDDSYSEEALNKAPEVPPPPYASITHTSNLQPHGTAIPSAPQPTQAWQDLPIVIQPGQQQMMQPGQQQMMQPGQQQMMMQPGQQQMMMQAQIGAGMNLFSNHLNNMMQGSNKHSGLLNVVPDVWMPKPEGGPIVPPGLEYLTVLDQVHVYQQVNIMAVMNRSGNSSYKILNVNEQIVYTAAKQSPTARSTIAGFGLGINDANGQEVIRTGRDSKCCSGAPCCSCINSTEFTIESPPGQLAGYVSQGSSFSSVAYNVESGDGKLLYKITSPSCFLCGNCDAHRNAQFKIVTADTGEEVGTVTGMAQDLFQKQLTNSAGFVVNFDGRLDAREKALVLACGFFVEANFYAQVPRSGRHHHH